MTNKKIVAYSKKALWTDHHGVQHEGYIMWEHQKQGVLEYYEYYKEPMSSFLKSMLK